MILITLAVLINLALCQISTTKKSPLMLQFCESGIFCNGKTITCRDGFTCKWDPSGINIGCCTKLPPVEEEPELATCGGFANKQCQDGFTCKLNGNGSDLGTCVRAMCGGFAGAKCPSGYQCVYLMHADYGYCYTNNQ
jgi:hypothetical protein